jgi:uncharacterized protein (TIGR00369 family)
MGVDALTLKHPPDYATLPREALQSLSGEAVLQGIITGDLPQAPVSEGASFWLSAVGEGSAVFEGEPGPHLLNPAGTVHGGWALTLIDSACACAAHSLLAAGVGYASVETKANFTRPIRVDTGRVRCAAHVVGRGNQIISAEAVVRSIAGDVLAHGTSTIMVLPPRN